ncbi:hypothetical protein [Comamonas sp. NoAH]|uniref:hypothetical protein n=1 Tax=Comamonas halotolerans TaxID=3041496 RepID=UPI0024E07140|nr:hypothetical protein [Comamonas sp. NoAH]
MSETRQWRVGDFEGAWRMPTHKELHFFAISALAKLWRIPIYEDKAFTSTQAIIDQQGETIAFAVNEYKDFSHPPEDQRLQANARLIAAAPDLLEALKAMEYAMSHAPNPHMTKEMRDQGNNAIISARAAIAKAKAIS